MRKPVKEMKSFVIGYISFFDNELKISKHEAESDIIALRNFIYPKFHTDEHQCDEDTKEKIRKSTIEELKQMIFDADGSIDIIEIEG
jgi:hypothetical protein